MSNICRFCGSVILDIGYNNHSYNCPYYHYNSCFNYNLLPHQNYDYYPFTQKTNTIDLIEGYDKKKLEELLGKFNAETLTKDEVDMLKQLLLLKQDIEFQKGDKVTAIGIGFLIIALIKYKSTII